jgi:hypothetical protein
MTLSVAWVRSVGNVQELVFASDSRLRGGEAWDCCPKILSFPRSDCLVAFAGSTWWAYPLMLQMAKAVDLYPGSRQRRQDIVSMKAHALRVFEQMTHLVHDLPDGQSSPDTPDTQFLFGGFSWREGGFRIWHLHFDAHLGRYTFAPTRAWPGQETGTTKVVAFAGDVAVDAKHRLNRMLRERGKIDAGGFDMEPFEVLRDMIRSGQYPTVGGAPQMAKVYRFMRSQSFGVLWPDAEGEVHVDGRPALDYEHFDAPVIDPDRPEVHARSHIARIRSMVERDLPDTEEWAAENEDQLGEGDTSGPV